MEIAGLRIGSPVNKAIIESACVKLSESGILGAFNYRYASTPKGGYALTLNVSDSGSLAQARMDFPGIDENALWQWLMAKYPTFDHKVPGNGAAQQFLAKKIEEHLGAALDGQHVVTRYEAELAPPFKMFISFQPETLPRIASMKFIGQQELTQEELAGRLQKVVASLGYTDRHFREAVEMNLRPAYEERGMYRVKFPNIEVQKADASSLIVTTSIEEGPKYKLGDVELAGENLPTRTMLKAANFKPGQIANWAEIQRSIWEMERPLRRTGYMRAAAKPERVFHDDRCVLDLKIPFDLGPLYHFGQLRISGLSPALEAQARKVWKMQPGDRFDYDYPQDFLPVFSQFVVAGQFKKFDIKMAEGAGDHVMDFTLIFEAH